MATSIVQLQLISKYFVIYIGLFVFILGIIGNILNIIIFTSLKTFRKNSCAFSLLISSIVSCGILLFNFLSYILYRGFDLNMTVTSTIWCKMQTAFAQDFNLLMLTSICLAVTDQCMSTTIHKGISLKLMKRLLIIAFVIWTLHGIPFLINWNIQDLPGTNERVCTTNVNHGVFYKYLVYVYFPIMTGFLPISIMSILALIAFRNIRRTTNRKIHIIRLRLEQQLTAMVLIKIAFLFLTTVPFTIVYIISLMTPVSNNNFDFSKKQFITMIFTMLFFLGYGDSFYIFLATSRRFRRQLKYVLVDMHLKRWSLTQKFNRIQPTSRSTVLSITNALELK